MVLGDPLRSKPKSVQYKLHLDFFVVSVLGSLGEQASYRLPMRKAADGLGLMVVNLASATVGVLRSLATVGPKHRPMISVDILARGSSISPALDLPVSLAQDLVMHADPYSVLVPPIVGVAQAPDVVGDDAAAPQEHTSTEARPDAVESEPTPESLLMSCPVSAGEEDQIVVTHPAGDMPNAVPAAAPPRRSPRLASIEPSKCETIIDKAVQRKQKRLEGSRKSVSIRKGELPSEDLIVVAVEAGSSLKDKDVLELAIACDISQDELDMGQLITSEPTTST